MTHAHNKTTGLPLPSYILNRSVAYVPMMPSEHYARVREMAKRTQAKK